MDIITNKIQLALSDEEASIFLNALIQFTGIYEGKELKHPDDVARQKKSIKVAEHLRDVLEAELIERYHNSREAFLKTCGK